MVDILENIAEIKLKRNYLLDKPKELGRSSNNDLARKMINWDTTTVWKMV